MLFLWIEPEEVTVHSIESVSTAYLGGPVRMKTDRGSALIACTDESIAAKLAVRCDMTGSMFKLLRLEELQARIAGQTQYGQGIVVLFDSLSQVEEWELSPGAFAAKAKVICLEELLAE